MLLLVEVVPTAATIVLRVGVHLLWSFVFASMQRRAAFMTRERAVVTAATVDEGTHGGAATWRLVQASAGLLAKEVVAVLGLLATGARHGDDGGAQLTLGRRMEAS